MVYGVMYFVRRNVVFLCLPALLGACVGAPATSNPTPPALKAAPVKPKLLAPKGYKVSGQVEDWNFGELVLRAEIIDGDEKTPIAESTIAADGSFEISLPPSGESFATEFTSWSSQTCQEFYASNNIPVLELSGPGYTVMPGTLDQAYIEFRAYSDVNDPDSAIWIQQRHDEADSYGYLGYEFSETAGNYKGRCAGTYAQSDSYDEGETFDITMNMNYVAGWNTELYSFYETETGTRRIISVAPVPASFTWVFYDNQ